MNPSSYLWIGDMVSSLIVNQLIEEIYIIVS